MNESLKPILAELKQRLTELYGERLSQLILFGSQARGDATEDSDVDVLVVLEGEVDLEEEVRRTSDLRLEYSLEKGTLICPVFTSKKRYQERNSPLLMNVQREGLRL
ncbi:MAG: nucleotidyltransferase domain-containing protein [bacterium]|nr:nucleotidyltransferase domain-containing protein [bacterium]